jgi:formylglycine-generating enzyme required for sulfatase activity
MQWKACLVLACLLVGVMPVACGPATPEPSAGDTWTRPADGAVMVYVPAGEFLMGSTDDYAYAGTEEKPQHTVYLDAFWIDRTEVTNAQYRQCVDAGACEEPRCWDEDELNAPDQPVVCVSWNDAQAYAVWAGGRMPTEAEWEKAARGTDGRIYPWGNSAPDCSKANYQGCEEYRPLPVGSHPDGASPYAALDMAGNVYEWVADWYDVDYYSRSPDRNPQGPDTGRKRVVRGGSLYTSDRVVRCAYRISPYPSYMNRDLGFRVVVAPDDL